jgi:hypothetical protein
MNEINCVSNQPANVPPQAAYARPSGPFGIPAGPPVELKPIAPWIWVTSILVILVVAAVAVFVFRSWREQTRLTEPVVANLHLHMTQSDDAGILADADPAYRTDMGVRGSNDLFDYVRARLGAPHESHRISTYVLNSPNSGEIVTMRYETVFDKGTATETIKLHNEGGVYRLSGYSIDSRLLRQDNQPSATK